MRSDRAALLREFRQRLFHGDETAAESMGGGWVFPNNRRDAGAGIGHYGLLGNRNRQERIARARESLGVKATEMAVSEPIPDNHPSSTRDPSDCAVRTVVRCRWSVSGKSRGGCGGSSRF